MPIKDNLTQLFLKTERGEYKPIEKGMNLEVCEEIVSNHGNTLNNVECFEGMEEEIPLKVSKKDRRKFKKLILSRFSRYFKNNWRKKHHLPLIRWRKKQ